MLNCCCPGISDRKEVNLMLKASKDKKSHTIHKFLHKILSALELIYEICKVLVAIIKLFF